MFAKLFQLYHTIKYLKFKQVVWRFIFILPRFTPSYKKHPQIKKIYFQCISTHGITNDYDSFIFLNEKHKLSETGWDNSKISKLWRYNLHYFDFLRQKDQTTLYLEIQKKIINKWIIENPIGKGTAWEPYPTSLRIINWIKWHWKTNALNDEAQLNLWNQTRWLAARPEYHLLGNHLFVNAKALLFSCVFFGLDKKSIIYKRAIKILNKELNEQFLADGAHFELSPMYHALAMEDLLDLYQLSTDLPKNFPSQTILKKYKDGMKWLSLMKYDNDELSHFNDCANGVAPKFKVLEEMGRNIFIEQKFKLQDKLNHLKQSGFVVYKNENFHLIADVGQIGPSYLPGHAHADTLSFELAINGQRVIVNSGTSEYGLSKERIRQRSTVSHSTIEIDNQSSSEVWSGFRVARRAKVKDLKITDLGGRIEISAMHNGYNRLVNSPNHTRKWVIGNNYINIIDEVSGLQNSVIIRFYIHPSINIEKSDEDIHLISSHVVLAKISTNLSINVIDSSYHDKFGKSQINKCLLLKGISPLKSNVTINFNT